MASNSLSKLAMCKLCAENFSDPRMLPCLHSFCYDCLRKHFDSRKSNYACPTCHEAFELPNGKMEAIPKNFHGSYLAEVADYEERISSESTMNCDRCVASSENEAVKFCCDCCKFLCSWCTKDHARRQKTHKHELVDLGEKNKKQQKSLLKSIHPKRMFCQYHSDEVLKFYCKSCSSLICRDCMVLSHSGHTCDRVEAVADKEKKDLLVTVQKAENATSSLENSMGKGEKIIQNIKLKQNAVDEKIKKSFKELHEALNDREESLLAKSAELCLGKVTALKLQGEEIKSLYDELIRVCSIIKESTTSYTPEQMLSAKSIMNAKLEKILKLFDACALDPCKNDIMHTELSGVKVKEEIGKYGAVTGGSFAAGSTASLLMPLAIKGKVKTISVTTRDVEGRQFYQRGISIRAKLGLIGSNDFDVDGTVKDNGNGIYDISITPQSVGEHQLNITVEGEHIKQSPFVIGVRECRSYTSLSCQQNYNATSQPWDVACSDKDEIFVVNYGYHCIQVINKQTGNAIRTIGTGGSYGTGNLQFYYPSSIAIEGDIIYITENSNNRIQKLTTSGKHLSTFGSSGSDEGQLSNPRGICIGPENKIYVAEYSNNRISVFQADESFDSFITGNMSNPWGIAFDPMGNLHVANYSSHKITVFTSEGKFLREYGSGNLQYPAGIAIDPEGYVFVSEYYNSNNSYNYSRLFIFSPQYTLVKTIQAFRYAVGVALDKDGYIYVCDQNNTRVCKY